MGPVEIMRIGWDFNTTAGLPGDWNVGIHKNLRKHSNNMHLVAYD